MNGNDPFDTSPEQLAISYELLRMLHWLIEHEQEALKELIEQAAFNKRLSQAHQTHGAPSISDQELQHSVVDFFGLMDTLLIELAHDRSMSSAAQQNLMPSLQQIDSAACDDMTILMSLDQATAQLNAHPEQDAKKVLYEELLRQWEPDEKTLAN